MNSFKMDFSFYEDLIEVLKPKSVLELGCGMGRLFPIFMQEAKQITGVDLSEEMISQGIEYCSGYKKKNVFVEFVHADICSFSIDKKYDLIVFALSVLKHLKTEAERFEALKNAKKHLNKGGLILIDHTPFLYASHSTDWIDAETSLVANWVPKKSVLDGYQWKKTIEDDIDILQWRYNRSGETKFEVKFTTYRYDIDQLIKHINQLEMSYEHLLREWGSNGLGNQGKRFIGWIDYPGHNHHSKDDLIEKVLKRQERLWSDHDLYLENRNKIQDKALKTAS